MQVLAGILIIGGFLYLHFIGDDERKFILLLFSPALIFLVFDEDAPMELFPLFFLGVVICPFFFRFLDYLRGGGGGSGGGGGDGSGGGDGGGGGSCGGCGGGE